MKSRITLIIIFLLFVNLLTAQQNKKESTKAKKISSEQKKLEAKARKLFFYEDYANAAPLFEKLDEMDEDKTKYDYLLGICYLYMHANEKAQFHLSNAAKRNDTPVQVYYYLGKADHLNNNFDEAIKDFEFYKDTLKKMLTKKIVPKDPQLHAHNQKTIEEVDREIEMCKIGKRLMENKRNDVTVTNVGEPLNSKYPEYTPVFSNNEEFIFINSRRPESKRKKSFEDDEFYEDIFISYKINGRWSEPKNIAEQMNENFNTNYHDAVVSISHDGEHLILYRSTGGKNSTGDLYLCDLREDEWSNPKPFPAEINSPFSETHACLGDDGNILYFVSDRIGGKGGKDIYVSKKENGKWSKPQNLGDVINTLFDEESPYITPDGKTLYFSSNGHETMGGFDIFKSTYDPNTNTWSKPENLGYPINSSDHDIYLQWSLDGKTGYFTSIRPDTKGEKDIYKITGASEFNRYTVLKGKIMDSENRNPLRAEIILTDLNTGKVNKFFSDSLTGRYLITVSGGARYDMDVAAIEHYIFEDSILIPDAEGVAEIRKDILLKPFKLNEHVILKNIFFDYNSSELRPESERELNALYTLMAYNPTLKLEIGGHTDSIANDDYNLKLSEERANAVVNYLVNRGISPDRLKAVGYGETQPIASNATPEGRQLNRRTEFVITDVKFSKKIKALTDSSIAITGMRRNKINFFSGRSSDFTVEIGHVLQENVHFPHNEYKVITDYSKNKIENVINLLNKNPRMKIKIIAYSEDDEIQLVKDISDRRAKLVYDYMISKGVKKEQLLYEGAKDAENEWAGRARRVEFLVMEL
jgi:outer membrane protein OmpA-like peptidoglycan-associated protein/tetratricopeptide (TPR) repeat protein